MSDPLAGEQSSSSYSEDSFYVGSRDRRGFRGSSIRVPLSPEVSGELAALVASRIFPEYRTTADVVRDALVHRLHYLNTMPENRQPSDIVRRMMADYIMQEAVDRMRYRKNTIANFEAMAREARTEADKQRARIAITQAVENDPELAEDAQNILRYL